MNGQNRFGTKNGKGTYNQESKNGGRHKIRSIKLGGGGGAKMKGAPNNGCNRWGSLEWEFN